VADSPATCFQAREYRVRVGGQLLCDLEYESWCQKLEPPGHRTAKCARSYDQ